MNTIERVGNLITRIESQVVDLDNNLTPDERRTAKVLNPLLELWAKDLYKIQNELRELKLEINSKL